MTTALNYRQVRTALIAGLALPILSLLPSAGASTAAKAAITTSAGQQSEPATVAEFKSILAQYGKFVFHQKYGEVWVPTVTPQGWHPYPACQWVYAKDIGWYFRDDTAWGSIVHHYGRWSHDEQVGWFWVADEDWSPGWVVWRSSPQWIGWAPMPPEQDIQLISSPEFNNDKLWIFMEAQKFLQGGCGDTIRASNVYEATQYVTLFDLPPGLLVDLVVVPKWKVKVIHKFVTIYIDRQCPPPHRNPQRPPLTHVPPRASVPVLPPAVRITQPPAPTKFGRPGRHERIGKPSRKHYAVVDPTPRRRMARIGRTFEPKPVRVHSIGRSMQAPNFRGGGGHMSFAKFGQRGRGSFR